MAKLIDPGFNGRLNDNMEGALPLNNKCLADFNKSFVFKWQARVK